jgi:uncharacterized protein (TIGR04255 family)
MNWRRRHGESYLRYNETSGQFAEAFREFQSFCREVEIEEPKIDLCEVCYVNRIQPLDGQSLDQAIATVFGAGVLGLTADWLKPPAGITLNRRFDFSEQRGRLYAEASTANDPEGEFILLKMTARVDVSSTDDWFDRMRLAHDWVVNGFVAITSQEVRRLNWRQIE